MLLNSKRRRRAVIPAQANGLGSRPAKYPPRAESPSYPLSMPQSLAFVLVHIILSTKGCTPIPQPPSGFPLKAASNLFPLFDIFLQMFRACFRQRLLTASGVRTDE